MTFEETLDRVEGMQGARSIDVEQGIELATEE